MGTRLSTEEKDKLIELIGQIKDRPNMFKETQNVCDDILKILGKRRGRPIGWRGVIKRKVKE